MNRKLRHTSKSSVHSWRSSWWWWFSRIHYSRAHLFSSCASFWSLQYTFELYEQSYCFSKPTLRWFFPTASHFAASQRHVELHFFHIQRLLVYGIFPPTQHIHPLPPTSPLFPPYDSWSAPAQDDPTQGDEANASDDPFGSLIDDKKGESYFKHTSWVCFRVDHHGLRSKSCF